MTPVSAVSVWPSQPRPSSALRAYCFWSEIDERIRIDAMVSLGESDGRLRTRPVETCSWMAASLARLDWSELSECWLIMFWVTREMAISAPVRSG